MEYDSTKYLVQNEQNDKQNKFKKHKLKVDHYRGFGRFIYCTKHHVANQFQNLGRSCWVSLFKYINLIEKNNIV